MDAREQVAERVPRGTMDRLDRYVALLVRANEQQNLVSSASLPHIWQRHILDAVQLADLAPPGDDRWIDIGSGAGLPGIVLAAMLPAPITLVEPRAKRAAFLEQCVTELELGSRVDIRKARIEVVRGMTAGVITARAVASLDALFRMASHVARPDSVWILPKGRSAREEVVSARTLWQGAFELVPSRTDAEASIVVARNVSPRNDR